MVNALLFFSLLIARWCNGILCRYQSLAQRGTLNEAVKRNDHDITALCVSSAGKKKIWWRVIASTFACILWTTCDTGAVRCSPGSMADDFAFSRWVVMVWEKRGTMIYGFYFCTIRYRYASPINAKEISFRPKQVAFTSFRLFIYIFV